MTSTDLESIYQNESRHVLATLLRLLGDFELAEEALHDAFLAAAEQWPREGVPRNPRSWLISTGRFSAIDTIRRRARYEGAVQRFARVAPTDEALNVTLEYIADDDLRLIFLCCHPALSLDAQVALTLREACGLTTEEIAQAFVAKPSAIAQRIVRAKTKIRDARIAYELPHEDEVSDRVQAVLQVLYLLFNEGYDASFGPTLVRADLAREAIRLGRMVAEMTREPEASALVALMTFHHARRNARTTQTGEVVLLSDQDRETWDWSEIAQATAYLHRACDARPIGRYALEASIAEVHATARRADQTDWRRIVELYDALFEINPSPIVALNRAVAFAMVHGPAAGLAQIDEIFAEGRLQQYRFAHAARADMYRRLGRTHEARDAYVQALALTQQETERRFIMRRLSELEAAAVDGGEAAP